MYSKSILSSFLSALLVIHPVKGGEVANAIGSVLCVAKDIVIPVLTTVCTVEAAVVSGPPGAIGCATGGAIAGTAAKEACKAGGKKRDVSSVDIEKIRADKQFCGDFGEGFGNTCIKADDLFKMGDISNNEKCTPEKLGFQRCVGDQFFITCDVTNDWTIKQMCGQGTRCQTHPSSADKILCGF